MVLTGVSPTEDLLNELSIQRIRHADLVVLPHGDKADEVMLRAIGHRVSLGHVLTPRRLTTTRWPQSVVAAGDKVIVGNAVIEVIASTPVLSVHVDASGR